MPGSRLETDAALRHLREVGGLMAVLIERHGPPRFKRTRNSFRHLVRTIVNQQLSGKAADTIFRRFLALFPHGRFPAPAVLAAISPERLRSAGLSQAKAGYLIGLAEKFADGTLQPRRFARMNDEDVAAVLSRVKGIGPWSVDMFLLSALNRPDVLPVGDVGLRNGMRIYFALEEPPGAGDMIELARPWRPYRSVASWYLWALADGGLPPL